MDTEGLLPRGPERWHIGYSYQLEPGKHVSLFNPWDKWGTGALVVLTKEQVAVLARMFEDED